MLENEACRSSLQKTLLVMVRTHLPGATVLGTDTKLAIQHGRQRIKTQCQLASHTTALGIKFRETAL